MYLPKKRKQSCPPSPFLSWSDFPCQIYYLSYSSMPTRIPVLLSDLVHAVRRNRQTSWHLVHSWLWCVLQLIPDIEIEDSKSSCHPSEFAMCHSGHHTICRPSHWPCLDWSWLINGALTTGSQASSPYVSPSGRSKVKPDPLPLALSKQDIE